MDLPGYTSPSTAMARPDLSRATTYVLVSVFVVGVIWGLWQLTAPSLALAPQGPATSAEAGGTASGKTPSPHLGSRQSVSPATTDLPLPQHPQRAEDHGGRKVTIRVIEKLTRSGVANAQVSVMARPFDWSSMSASDKRLVSDLGNDHVSMYAHFGGRQRTDAEGYLRLVIDKRLYIACSHEGNYGELNIRSDTVESGQDYELLLGEDFNVRVLVRNEDGDPLPDFPLGLYPVWSDPELAERRRSQSNLRTRKRTGADGTANFHHLQLWQSYYSDIGSPDRVRLELCHPGAEACQQTDPIEFVLASPPPEIIERTAPATGSVILAAFDSVGRQHGSYEDLILRSSTRQGEKPQTKSFGGISLAPAVARFPYVALGASFEGRAVSPLDIEEKAFSGPLNPGETVRVELHATAPEVLVVARVVNSEGDPVGPMRIRYDWATSKNDAFGVCECDDQSLIHLDIPTEDIGETFSRALLQRLDRFETTAQIGELPRNHRIHAGINDLGDIVLRLAPILVAGQILIDGNAPGQRPKIFINSRTDTTDWARVRDAAIKIESKGRFSIRGLHPTDHHHRYQLIVSAQDAEPISPIEFAPGESGLHVELVSGASVQAQILMDEFNLVYQIRYELTPVRPTATSRRALHGLGRIDMKVLAGRSDDAPPALTWRGLPKGRYVLRLWVLGRTTPIYESVLDAGAEATVVDLRGKLHSMQLRLQQPDHSFYEGELLALQAGILAAEGSGCAGLIISTHDRLLLAGADDLLLIAADHQPVSLSGLSGNQTVQLQDLARLSIELPAQPSESKKTYRLSLRYGKHAWEKKTYRMRQYSLPVMHYIRPRLPAFNLGPKARVEELKIRRTEVLNFQFWCRDGKQSTRVEASPRQVRVADANGTIALRLGKIR